MYLTEISQRQLNKLPLVERQAIYFLHQRMIQQFQQFEKILAASLKRAEGCGCTQCWHDYEVLCEEILQKYSIPDEDGSPEDVRLLVERYSPQLKDT